MILHLPRTLRSAAKTAITAAAATALLATTLTAATGEAAALGRSATFDPYPGYEGQTTCASTVLPGTRALLNWLIRTNPGTGSSGTLRACDVGGSSEHKDGRALDWRVDADNPTQARQAKAVLAKLFATDSAGNTHALARRLGIMYLIWDDEIYSAPAGYKPRDYTHYNCATLAGCSKTLRHRDHVHISLSRSGAAAQTSWYRARGIDPVAVKIPGTNQLDMTRTMVSPATAVPADGTAVTTRYKVTAGSTYQLVATGLVRYGAGARIGDAACAYDTGSATWTPLNPGATDPTTGVRTPTPAEERRGLTVNGQFPWTSRCNDRHAVSGTWTAKRTQRLTLRVADTDRAAGADNDGAVTFYLVNADIYPRSMAPKPTTAAPLRTRGRIGTSTSGRLLRQVLTVRADAARGVRTTKALVAGHRYRIRVTGTARSGAVRFDGNCVRYAGRLRPQHTLDLTTPTADHLSLHLAGRQVPLRPRVANERSCTSTHDYRGLFTSPVTGTVRAIIADPSGFADNRGELRTVIRKVS